MLYLFLVSALTLFIIPCIDSNSIVTTNLGKIRGHYKESFENRTFLAFEGIPYAKPPIGEKRFEAPEPIEKWDGIWDATFLFECVQVAPPIAQLTIIGDEDCLYLNIYVPRTHINISENLDVIVHIHGGGFMFGSGHAYAFPEYLMDENVIFVTFNYRLGIFGFLSTEDEVLPGNNGMKDQVLALQWVHDHIANFGGNPNSVTLTGASAGGVSVHLHYLSPLSRGLFQRGLSQSGSALNPIIQKGALDKAKILGVAVGCSQETSKILKECLKQRSYWQILTKLNLFYGYKEFPLCPFSPVVEKAPGAFLDEEPYKLLKLGRVQNLPWVASFVPQEAVFIVSVIGNNIEEINLNWSKYASLILNYNYSIPKDQWENVAKKSKEFYLGKNQKFTEANVRNFVKLISDGFLIDGIVKSGDLQAQATKASVYLYEFSYTGSKKNIVEHSDDNQYFFYDKTGEIPGKDELKMKNVMIKMLVTYAKTGKPVIDGVVWKPVESDKINFLNISSFKTEDIKLLTDANVGNGELWDSLHLLNF